MAGSVKASAKIKKATIEAVVTRSDGSVERLGVVSYYSRNPLKRWLWKLGQAVKRIAKK